MNLYTSFLYGREMQSDDNQVWNFKDKSFTLKHNTLYKVKHTYNSSSDPYDSSSQYYVEFIEEVPKHILNAMALLKEYKSK